MTEWLSIHQQATCLRYIKLSNVEVPKKILKDAKLQVYRVEIERSRVYALDLQQHTPEPGHNNQPAALNHPARY